MAFGVRQPVLIFVLLLIEMPCVQLDWDQDSKVRAMCPNIKANGSYEEIKDTLVSIHMGHGTKLMSLGGR